MNLFYLIRSVFSIAIKLEKKEYLKAQLVIIIAGLLEAALVLSLASFLSLAMTPEESQGSNLYVIYAKYFSEPNHQSFVAILGVVVFFILLLASTVASYSVWLSSVFSQKLGARISTILYRGYLEKPWVFHLSKNSSELTNNITQESVRLTNGILMPSMNCNAKLVLLVFMSVALFLYDPVASIALGVCFIALYSGIYLFLKNRVVSNGKMISEIQRDRFRIISEGFGGIRDIIRLDKKGYFVEAFEEKSNVFAKKFGANLAYSQMPKYAIEFFIYSAIVLLAVFSLFSGGSQISGFVPTLALYGIAGLKILPAYQFIYSGISTIKSNSPAFLSVKEDLACFMSRGEDDFIAYNGERDQSNDVPFSKENVSQESNECAISVKNVSYCYPGSDIPSLNNVTMSFRGNSLTGIIGRSGSGKSTLIDVLVGLLEPATGCILVSNELVCKDNKNNLMRKIGLVPQSIYLLDATIRKNVAFGIDEKDIDDERVREVLRLACLDDLLKQFSGSIEARLGERGCLISGGQLQRIGIARALYGDPEIIILDEPTSSLDGETERFIMQMMYSLSRTKTVIVVAHGLNVVEQADIVYQMENGMVKNFGKLSDIRADGTPI